MRDERREWAAWAVMIAAVLPGVLLFLGVTSVLSSDLSGLAVFLMPLPTLLATHWLYRPHRRPSFGLPDDWSVGRHPWVQIDGSTRWTVRDEVEALSSRPSPVECDWAHDGFTLVVPARTRPRLSLEELVKASWKALVAGAMLILVPLAVRDVLLGREGMGEMLCVMLVLPLVVGVGSAVLLAFWSMVVGVGLALMPAAPPIEVKLAGRTLLVEGRSFALGHPEQLVELGDGELILARPGARLVIPGAAAHLVFLKSAIERVTGDVGSVEDVPEALGELVRRRDATAAGRSSSQD